MTGDRLRRRKLSKRRGAGGAGWGQRVESLVYDTTPKRNYRVDCGT